MIMVGNRGVTLHGKMKRERLLIYWCFDARYFSRIINTGWRKRLSQITTKSSSRDETANVNFLRRHRARNTKYRTYCPTKRKFTTILS